MKPMTLIAVTVMALALCAAKGAGGEKPLKTEGLSVKGVIEGENITFTVSFTVESKRAGRELPLVTGVIGMPSS